MSTTGIIRHRFGRLVVDATASHYQCSQRSRHFSNCHRTLALASSTKRREAANACRRSSSTCSVWNYNSNNGLICYFSTDTNSSTSNAFDRSLKQRQRDNAARAHSRWRGGEDVVDYDYFRQEMAFRLVDRLDDIKREEGFPLALDIGTYFKKQFSNFVEQVIVSIFSALVPKRMVS